MFAENKNEITPKYIIYLVPSYDSNESNPFRILMEDELKDYETYLSEYIAKNDYIYKNIIFMPFSSTCDIDQNFHQELNNIKMELNTTNNNNENNPFEYKDIKTFYSFLKKPLDIYLGDSNGIFNLDLYKISINENVIEKIFWKNIDIIDKNNDNSRITKLTMTCVDYLGLEKKKK